MLQSRYVGISNTPIVKFQCENRNEWGMMTGTKPTMVRCVFTCRSNGQKMPLGNKYPKNPLYCMTYSIITNNSQPQWQKNFKTNTASHRRVPIGIIIMGGIYFVTICTAL